MDSTDSSLVDQLTLQLSEIEMLSSMYPDNSEFYITLPSIIADMNRYVEGKTQYTPNELDFVLNLDIPDIKEKLEVNIIFPHQYPSRKPSISCRSLGLSRTQQRELNSSARNYIDSLPNDELCSISIINWLTENAANYFSLKTPETDSDSLDYKAPSPVRDIKCRLWVYSHHIYSKFKRREIIDSAQDLNLTGFSLPGKPGFICVEGDKRDCYEFLHNLKQMTWKKLSLVKEETVVTDSDESDFKKFDKFQEISFQVRRGPAKEYHMDMGQFLKYLEEHNCSYAFNDLLGLEGHSSGSK
ncbi:RWD domain-containing protein 2A [Parasteatoda tepidariorum]|uniref:RWD domain-containing protein 2A n=1 Tax=Parasteatoda tepidariorum TaxID=114398 RepID=UPI00077F8A51|nr:RWD domain-containing protein 2A [Parasteatoda tepidariorum]